MRWILGIIIGLSLVCTAYPKDIAVKIEGCSVLVDTTNGAGTGVMFERKVVHNEQTMSTRFVLTAGHVVIGNRRKYNNLVCYLHPIIKRGDKSWKAHVLKCDMYEDIALLTLAEDGCSLPNYAEFTNKDDLVEIGDEVWHCGCPDVQQHSNSILRGIPSRKNTVFDDKLVYDQLSICVGPGCSGGGVFTQQGKHILYIGMVVSKHGGQAHMVPIRRLREFFLRHEMPWVLDKAAAPPKWEDIIKMPVESPRVLKNGG